MMKGIFLLDTDSYKRIYGEDEVRDIAARVDLYAPPQNAETVARDPSVLRDAQVIFSGWGIPRLDEALLAHAPGLKMLFYGAGSLRSVVSEAFWNRGIRVCTAYASIAPAVAQYALAWTIICLKRFLHYAAATRQARTFTKDDELAGAFGSTVGIVSLGMVGRRFRELLRALDVKVIAYDPYASEETARSLGVALCGLDELFQRADCVSVHTPWLPETENLIRGRHIRSMKPGAGLVNSSRGAVINEAEMIEALRERQDIQAVIDVTHPEPPAPDSPLYTLPNVILTPHMAGNMGPEVHRQGRTMIEEFDRWVAGEPLLWEITREKAATMA